MQLCGHWRKLKRPARCWLRSRAHERVPSPLLVDSRVLHDFGAGRVWAAGAAWHKQSFPLGWKCGSAPHAGKSAALGGMRVTGKQCCLPVLTSVITSVDDGASSL